MNKHWLLIVLSLAVLSAVNLRPGCRIEICGEEVDGLYSAAALRRCEQTVRAAAEEILPGPAVLPECRRHWVLSLRPPEGDERLLCDRMLRGVTGIAVRDGVFVNGTRLGTVGDGQLLTQRLRSSIQGQMPTAAVSGRVDGQLRIQRLYTRANRDTPYEDMILLITGMAPVVYLDREGNAV